MTASSMQFRQRPTSETERETLADVDSIAVLDALHDAVGRRILTACDGTPRTAQECADVCDVPLSTVYRKLGTLTDAGLLTEQVRIDAEHNFPREFETCFETLSVSVAGGDDVTVEVLQASTDGGVDENEVTR